MSEPVALPTLAAQAPYYVAWEITHRCDARCVHCYAGAGPEVETAGELSTAEALDVIDQLADAGRPMLAFSGGEPLLRPDWRQLIRYAVARDMVVTLVTNGSSVGERQADELRDLGVESVTVSLDSHRPEVHDDLRQLPGLFERACSAIERLAARGLRVVVNFTPTRRTWRHLRGIVELAHRLGASAVSLSEFVPVGRGTPEMAPAAEQLDRLLEEWRELREAYRDRMTLAADDRTIALMKTGAGPSGCPDCGAGRTAARITPAGTVTPCAFLPLPLGSFRQEAFVDLWRRADQVQEARARTGETGASCAACGFLVRSQE